MLRILVSSALGNFVGDSRLESSDLTLSRRTLFQLRHLLPLYRRGGNFLTQNDVSDLRLCQGCDVDAIPLAKVLRKV
jgi:hypothetical protein